MRMHQRWLPVLVLLGLAFTPAVAHANMGTALMWLPLLHFTCGNLALGCGEGVLIGLMFRGTMGAALFLMIVANYVSAFIGFVLTLALGQGFENLIMRDFQHALAYLWIAWILLFLGTLIVEFPFCWMIFKTTAQPRRKVIPAFLASQVVSYAVLGFLYIGASDMSMLTRTKIEPSLSFVKSPGAMVYYISAIDGKPWRRRLDGSLPERSEDPISFSKGISHGFLDLRPKGPGQLFPYFYYWGALIIRQRPGGEILHALRFETPMLQWDTGNGTILPGEQIVFQMGRLVVVMDMRTLQMAVVAQGRSPVVVLKKEDQQKIPSVTPPSGRKPAQGGRTNLNIATGRAGLPSA